VPLVLAGLPGPGMLQTAITGAATSTANEPKPLPIDYLRPELLKNAVEARAKAIAFGDPRAPMGDPRTPDRGDVGRFIDELKKMNNEFGQPKDKAATEKYIQDFIASRGLKHFGKSSEPRDEWSLEDDPGLLPLVEAQKASLRQAGPFHGNRYMPFGQSFFWTTAPPRSMEEVMNPRRGPATSGLYQAETYPPSARDPLPGQPRYVVWRTENIQPAKRNAATASARAAVVDAWKRMKARELAKAYADKMAEAIRANPATNEFAIRQFVADKAFELEAKINDKKLRQKVQPFAVTGVAPFVESNPLMAMQGQSGLERFDLKESEKLPYPTPEMQTALLENREKPAKTAIVLPDAPKDTFYVATLLDRRLKDADDFRREVYSRRGNARLILNQFYVESSKKARESVVDLLKKEFKYEETEEQKKKLDENAKSGGQAFDD
jgi:hypothetical protein